MSSSSRMILLATFLFSLAGIIFAIGQLRDNNKQFRLLQTPEPIPVLTLPPESPGYVPDQTLQSSPAVIDKEASPGEEIEPLLVTSTIDQDLRLRVRFQSLSSPEAIALSEKNFLLPANTKQNIGIRLREGVREDVLGSIVIRTEVVATREIEGGQVEGKDLLVRPSLALEVPVSLRLPRLAAEIPQWSLDPPELQSFAGGWRPEITIENISRRIVSGQGFFSLRGEGREFQASISDNQFIGPTSSGSLLGGQVWSDIEPGTYTLSAEVRSGDQVKRATRKVVIGKEVRTIPSGSAALLVDENSRGLFLVVRNNGDLSLARARAIVNQKEIEVPRLRPGQSREIEIPAASRVEAKLVWRGKQLDKISWQQLPDVTSEEKETWILVPIALALLAGAVIALALWIVGRRKDSKKQCSRKKRRSRPKKSARAKRARRRRRAATGPRRKRLVPSQKSRGRDGQRRYIRKR